MEIIKKLISILLIALIAIFAFVYGYTEINKGAVVFADTTTDNWQAVTTNDELVDAFRYYCKSRDLTIEGSIADGVTSFTTQTFNNICNALGYDMTALQAHLKKETDGSNIRYLFDSTGITAYNAIFAQFLQDNELQVGDYVDNDVIYSGKYFTDINGYSCVCTILNRNASLSNYNFNTGDVLAIGSPYKISSNNIVGTYGEIIGYSQNNLAIPLTNSLANSTLSIYSSKYKDSTSDYFFYTTSVGSYGGMIYGYLKDGNNRYDVSYGMVTVYYSVTNNNYNIGVYNKGSDNKSYGQTTINPFTIDSSSQQSRDLNIYLTTNNQTINNNNYDGDTIIYPDGTSDDGGGGGGDNPPTPTPEPDYTPAEDWDIDLPDLSVPDWILTGKENKFPFDIPFNVMYALTILQAEPQAPELEGSLDFGFTTWDYDIDLSDFDTVAQICRNMEFLAFLTGLMLMTRKLIWG